MTKSIWVNHIEAEGFRGIRGHLSIEVPRGFLVLSGSNGAGKSTIIDILEMALTGHLMRFSGMKEDKETIADYIWCRDGYSDSGYVEVGLVDEDMNQLVVRRDGNGLAKCSADELKSFLCDEASCPEEPLQELCLTSIIRADTISDLSMDLSETERYSLVRRAIGSFDYTEIESNLEVAYEESRAAYDEELKRQEHLQEEKVELMSQISELQSQIPAEHDTQDALDTLRRILQTSESDPTEVASVARDRLRLWKSQEETVQRCLTFIESIREFASERVLPTLGSVTPDEVGKRITALNADLEKNRASLQAMDSALEDARGTQSKLAKIKELAALGDSIGLEDGQCPLCGSRVEEGAFREHVEEILAGFKEYSTRIEQMLEERNELQDSIIATEQAIQKETELAAKIRQRSERVDKLREELTNLLDQLGFVGTELDYSEIEGKLTPYQEGLEQKSSLVRESLTVLESHVSNMQLLNLRKRLTEIRESYSKKENDVLRRKRETGKLKDILDAIRIISNEIVDEKLAEISPLLSELYARLRPHPQWSDIKYSIRGELRKFLSLRVGEDYNPRFMFSTGQRRAAGLAFSLALYHAKKWSHLRTLVLDDPVQHIDDYRALNIVETLSAIRQSGHQVICAVEDPRLAEFLGRRLRSLRDEEGKLVKVKHDDGVEVQSETEVGPFSSRILSVA